ncbi:hypothetical protein GTZ89_10785 [Streptomyces sp. SID8382]|uniref:hypothetical protein n=1 Tax=Streptomyces malaysiensis TaxID=92644 RepID=UPI00133163C4|nr:MULTISPECIES: hypothetical protein [unclassified Streptomyces]MYX56177.1 hypothetical protein [Streptomyces sp. SID8382]
MVEIGEFDRPGAREERHFVTHIGSAEILVGGGDHHETGAGGQCRSLASVVANLEQRAGISPEDVFIVLDAVDLSDFSVAGGRPFDPPHLHQSE